MKNFLLSELPAPPDGRSGWPWTFESPSVPMLTGQNSSFPKISVVTPSFNQADFIEETIRSVLLQNYPNLEYIIMDGGSKDGTVEILKKYDPYITFWTSRPDGGQSDAINQGWKRSNGDIIAWLNSDDVYLPGALAMAAEAFKADHNLDMLYGDCHLIDKDSIKFGESPTKPFSMELLVCNKWFISQPAAFFRRSLLDRIGFINRDLHLIMDWEFYLRIALAGFKIEYLPHPLASFRVWSDAKTSSQQTTSAREKFSVLHRIFSNRDYAVDIHPYRQEAFHYVHNWTSAEYGNMNQPVIALIHLFEAIFYKPSFGVKRSTLRRVLSYLICFIKNSLKINVPLKPIRSP